MWNPVSRYLVILLPVLAWGCASSPSEPADSGPLQERMTASEFRAAGLHRLDPSELRALNNWLRFGEIEDPEKAPGSARPEDWEAARKNPVNGFGLKPEPRPSEALDEIRVQIDSDEFTGWTGDTVLRLKNGQVWEQCGDGKLVIPPAEDPMAVIERGIVSGYRLQIDGYNSSVRVCRVE